MLAGSGGRVGELSHTEIGEQEIGDGPDCRGFHGSKIRGFDILMDDLVVMCML